MMPDIFSFLQAQVNTQLQTSGQNTQLQQDNSGTQPGVFDALITEYTASAELQDTQPQTQTTLQMSTTSQPLTFRGNNSLSASVVNILAGDETVQNIQSQTVQDTQDTSGAWRNLFADVRRTLDNSNVRNDGTISPETAANDAPAEVISWEEVTPSGNGHETPEAPSLLPVRIPDKPSVTPSTGIIDTEPETERTDTPSLQGYAENTVNVDPDTRDTDTAMLIPENDAPEADTELRNTVQEHSTVETNASRISETGTPEIAAEVRELPEEADTPELNDTESTATPNTADKTEEPSHFTPEASRSKNNTVSNVRHDIRGATQNIEGTTEDDNSQVIHVAVNTVNSVSTSVNGAEHVELYAESNNVNTPSSANEDLQSLEAMPELTVEGTDHREQEDTDVPETASSTTSVADNALNMAGLAGLQPVPQEAITSSPETATQEAQQAILGSQPDTQRNVQPQTSRNAQRKSQTSQATAGNNTEASEPEETGTFTQQIRSGQATRQGTEQEPLGQEENTGTQDGNEGNNLSQERNDTNMGMTPQTRRTTETSRAQNNRALSSSSTPADRTEVRNDFQSFFDGALRTRRAASGTPAQPLNLRTGTYTPSQSSTLREGIINTVRFIRADGVRKANIVVDPPALGRITVELTSSTSGVEASVKVANEQIRQIVQEQISQLRDNLSQQGVQVSEFTVDVQQDNSGQGQGQGSGRENQESSYTYTAGGTEEDTEDFRIDLEEGLLYWVA